VVELLIAVTIIVIMTAGALPAFMRSYRDYQVDNSASQLAGILKSTRFEAIRRNTLLTCQVKQVSADWGAWADSNGNGTKDASETQILITGNNVSLIGASSAPNPAAITTLMGISSLTVLSGSNASVQFDSRGAVNFGATAPTIYAFYLASSSDPQGGYRAVILMPSGVTHIWRASSAGDWRQVS
jgi:Tfp pilus assembly protein FimT